MSHTPGWRREQDAAGRARSARPRDEPGRPLPHDAAGAPGVPELLLPRRSRWTRRSRALEVLLPQRWRIDGDR
jgi:uncharacterized protein